MEECIICDDLMTNWPKAYEMGGWGVMTPAVISDILANVDNGGTGGTLLFSATETPGQIYKPDGDLAEGSSNDQQGKFHWSGSAVFDSTAGNWKIENLVTFE